MKKTYIRPEIGVEELGVESQILADSPTNVITNVTGSFGYGGGGSGPARAGESRLWDEEDEDFEWDQL